MDGSGPMESPAWQKTSRAHGYRSKHKSAHLSATEKPGKGWAYKSFQVTE